VGDGTLPCTDRTSLANLAKFIKLYDCKPTREILLCHLRDRLHFGWAYHLTAFACGAILGCIDTCIVALQAPVCHWTDKPRKEYATPGTIGKSMLHPAHWPLEVFDEVPTPYFVALLRAFTKYEEEPVPQGKTRPLQAEAIPRLFREEIKRALGEVKNDE
jgi:hypothetical protein